MLIRRGWKIAVHVSPKAVSSNGGPPSPSNPAFKSIERRLGRRGVEGICLGEATTVIAMPGERCRSRPGEYFIDGVLGLAALQHLFSRLPKLSNLEPDPAVDDSMPL